MNVIDINKYNQELIQISDMKYNLIDNKNSIKVIMDAKNKLATIIRYREDGDIDIDIDIDTVHYPLDISKLQNSDRYKSRIIDGVLAELLVMYGVCKMNPLWEVQDMLESVVAADDEYLELRQETIRLYNFCANMFDIIQSMFTPELTKDLEMKEV